MKVREKKNLDSICNSSKFNVHALAEVICYWDAGDADSMFIRELDVFIECCIDGEQIGWKDMRQAMKDKDIINDSYNTYFFEPTTKADRARGYTL